MPIWPFTLRRRKTVEEITTPSPPDHRKHSATTARINTDQQFLKRPSHSQEKAELIEDRDMVSSRDHNRNLGAYKSDEEITALPIKWRLDHSPHLRPVDSERAQIPYDFHNASKSGVPQSEPVSTSQHTLKSKRSTFDGSNSSKRWSSSKKRKDQHLREEEIRAMSVAMPNAKRQSDIPPHSDSAQRRTVIKDKQSAVSLAPPEKSTTGPSAKVVQQDSWDIHEFWYNPRPPVRLSKVPAYTWQEPTPPPEMPLARSISQKLKGKDAQRSTGKRRHRTIGDAADVLDSNDLRTLLERDTKRRQDRDQRRQERLDRKLRKVQRARTNSDISVNNLPSAREKEVEAGQRDMSSIHPALRPASRQDQNTGLGIMQPENPFISPQDEPLTTGYATPRDEGEERFEDPVIQTAREVRLSIAATPPLSPVDRNRRMSALPNEPLSPESLTMASPPQSPVQEPQAETALPIADASAKAARRVSTQTRDRRTGAWASFFRRSGTQKEEKPSQMSFTNTSRESMGRQARPQLLSDGESPFPKRSKSGPPTRTQSKFREDLPDAPITPSESRIQSPVSEMPVNAAAIAAAAREAELNSPGAMGGAARSDTPVSPLRGPDVMATSLASVDSEASWLASGGSTKRASVQSGLSRTLGSLRRRTPDLNASYEDLGESGDRDADYVHNSTEARRSTQMQRLSGSAVAGATREDGEEEEEEEEESINDTRLPVHGSVRRKATLVRGDPAVRSREGLLSEYAAGDDTTASAVQDDSSSDSEGQATRLENARSIDYGKGHARQVSAGSARLLDMPARRVSATPTSPTVVKHLD